MENIQATCSAELMDQISFINDATQTLTEYGLTKEQADAIAHLTVILEKNKY